MWGLGGCRLPPSNWLLHQSGRRSRGPDGSLANNHPFLDDNKRVAFDSSHTFLLMNGFTIEADPEETYAFMVGAIAEGRFRFPVILDWLNAHIKPM
jgi:prophage maintenance system killer protein